MNQHQVLKVPVRALRSTLVGNNLITGTSLTIKRTAGKPVTHPSHRSLGDSFLTRVGVEVVGVEVTTPRFSLSPPTRSNSNDNYCIEAPQEKDFVEYQKLRDLTQSVNLNVVCHVPCATGPSQRKDISPFQLQKRIKSVKPVCCVDHCLCVQHVNSVPLVVKNPPVGGRLQLFWQVWLSLGSNPRVVSILKEGYSLPFKIRPPLSRSPVIISHYLDPVKNKHLKESLQALILKQAVEKVIVPSSLAFYNRLFLVPKPNKWRPILDLSQLNLYLASATFNSLPSLSACPRLRWSSPRSSRRSN